MKNNKTEPRKRIMVAVDKIKWATLKAISSLEEKNISLTIEEMIDKHNNDFIKRTGIKF